MSMNITMKPLKGCTFDVEVEPTASIKELKAKVAEAQPEFLVEQQKLILAGRILTDDLVVQDIGIKPGAFIVVMLAKAKPPPANAAPAETTPVNAVATPQAPPVATSPAAPDATEQAAANVVTGGAAEATIAQLCDMGFGRPEVERCLQAAFGNPDRAVEYLMAGIPDGALAPEGAGTPAAGTAPPAQTAPVEGGAPPSAMPGGGGGGATAFPAMPAMAGGAPARAVDLPPALEELRNNPQFVQLAGVLAQNPQMLQQILPTIAQNNPELVQAIAENPEAFGQLLQEAAGGGAEQDPVEAMLAAARGGGTAQPGQTVVRLSEDELAAVQRLEVLGFDRQMCAQAYLACDKNEELAANFLFDGAGDAMMD